jgi:hypothetical protein
VISWDEHNVLQSSWSFLTFADNTNPNPIFFWSPLCRDFDTQQILDGILAIMRACFHDVREMAALFDVLIKA